MSTSSELAAGDGRGHGARGNSTRSIATTADLYALQTACDVTFDVRGESFMAHAIVLAARSPVFRNQLISPIMEKKKEMARIRVDNMEPTVFKALLHFIYTDSLPKIDDGDKVEMAKGLLVAADRYRMEKLKLICENTLLSCMDGGTVSGIFALAEQQGCLALKEACFKFLKVPGNLRTFIESDAFGRLARSCPSLLRELLHGSLDST